MGNENRFSLARAVSANLIVSLHVNADENTRTTSGAAVYYNEMDKEAAKAIGEVFCDSCGLRNDGEERRSDVPLLREFPKSALVIEMGYITNKGEALLMAGEDFQQRAAEGICRAVEDYVSKY